MLAQIISKAKWWARCIKQYRPEPFKVCYADGAEVKASVDDYGRLLVITTLPNGNTTRFTFSHEEALAFGYWIDENFNEDEPDVDNDPPPEPPPALADDAPCS